MSYKTEQEDFWTSNFAQDYIKRNDFSAENIAARAKLFSDVISRTDNVTSITEFGANIGLNLIALKQAAPKCTLQAIEISPGPFQQLSNIPDVTAINKSILELESGDLKISDLTFTSGVLIHINPDELPTVYQKLYQYSNRYIMVAEYYNPTPTTIPYHGKDDMLFKRDFAGDLLDTFTDLRLVDYGFKYRRDSNYPLGDITWFLLEKR